MILLKNIETNLTYESIQSYFKSNNFFPEFDWEKKCHDDRHLLEDLKDSGFLTVYDVFRLCDSYYNQSECNDLKEAYGNNSGYNLITDCLGTWAFDQLCDDGVIDSFGF